MRSPLTRYSAGLSWRSDGSESDDDDLGRRVIIPSPIVLNFRNYRRPGSRWAAYVLPEGAIRVDRRTRWGNPYTHLTTNTRAIYRVATLREAIEGYGVWLGQRLVDEPDFIEPLRGKQLACWCKPPEGFQGRLLCHAQVIAGVLYGIPAASVE